MPRQSDFPLPANRTKEIPRIKLFALITLCALAGTCSRGTLGTGPGQEGAPAGQGAVSMGLKLRTLAFKPGGDIPRRFSCEGQDVSPALSWTDPPAATESFALIADDPDAPAGTWVHWVVYDLPPTARQLPEGLPKEEEIRGGGHQGRNDFERIDYGGPCPPPGKPHRYFFKLYALDTMLSLKAGATKSDVERAMKGHILAQAELVGRYHR